MRTIWSALVVLVLLAPFGGVGITSTPVEAEIVTSPRGPAASLAQIRIESEQPPVVDAVATVLASAPAAPPRVVCTAAGSPASPIVAVRHPSAGPRDPPA